MDQNGTGFLIIGISGTTNAGKTTLATKLNGLFPQATTMCLDSYFLAPDDKRLEPYIVPEVGHVNWEQFGALDMESMIEDIDKWIENCRSPHSGSCSTPVLIIEGFLIFNHSVLKNYFHKKYFLTIDKDTCIERRRHRHYNPPDVPGYFEKVVWPMYLLNKQEILDQTDIVFMDGRQDRDSMVQQVASDVQQLIKEHSSSLSQQ